VAEGDESGAESTVDKAEKAVEEAHGAASEGRPTRKAWTRVLLVLVEILVVGVFAYLMGQVTTLTCDRVETDQVDCKIQSKWMGLVPLREQSVRSVRGAQVAEDCDEDEDGCTYRVELVASAGIVPLTSHYSSGHAAKESVAQRVNDFVRGPAASSLVVKDRSNPSMLIVVAVIVAGTLLWGLWRRHRSGAH